MKGAAAFLVAGICRPAEDDLGEIRRVELRRAEEARKDRGALEFWEEDFSEIKRE